MKIFFLFFCGLMLMGLISTSRANEPQVYVNQNFGFNIEGYNYTQSELPCSLNVVLVEQLVSRASDLGVNLQAVSTGEKLKNGSVPVLAFDIEELVLNKEFSFGAKTNYALPRVKVTAALIKGKNDMVVKSHACAIATINEFSNSSSVLDMGTYGVTVCDATKKCLNDLSKDVLDWLLPLLN